MSILTKVMKFFKRDPATEGATNFNYLELIANNLDLVEAFAKNSWHPAVADIAALKAIPVDEIGDGATIPVKSKGLYRYDAGSAAAADDDLVATPTFGVGRYIKIASQDLYTAYVRHSLAAAVNDFLVASAPGVWGKLTLAQVKTLLGVDAATTAATGVVELATPAETTTGTDTTRAVTPAGVKAALDALIAAAPGAMDTLDELAAALGDDPNFATTMVNALAGKAATGHNHAGVYATAAQGATADAAMPKAGGIFAGLVDFARNLAKQLNLKDYTESYNYIGNTSGAIAVNMNNGNFQGITLAGAATFSFTNPAAINYGHPLTLRIVQGATAYAVTWPASVKWNGNTAPDLSTINYTYDIVLTTIDGGTTWQGGLAAKYPN